MSNGLDRNVAFFIAGALVGSAAVALTTPYTGKKMRRAIRERFDECADQVSDATHTLRDAGEQIRHRGGKLVRGAERLFA